MEFLGLRVIMLKILAQEEGFHEYYEFYAFSNGWRVLFDRIGSSGHCWSCGGWYRLGIQEWECTHNDRRKEP
jgi:hypothetical protein